MQTSGPQATAGVGPRPDLGQVAAWGTRGSLSALGLVEDLGSDRFLYCAGDFRTVDAEAGGDGLAVLTARVPGYSAIGVGKRMMLRPHHDQVHVFSPTTGERLD
jgi:hypothetical protein